MNPPELEQQLTRELAGERLLWSGRPQQGLVLRPSDKVFIPVSLLWGGGIILCEALAFRQHVPLATKLAGIPLVLFGLQLIAGRFFTDAYQRARTIYGITPQRVIIIAGGLFGRTVKCVPLAGLRDVEVWDRPDGTGTIVLGRPSQRGQSVPTLELIPDVLGVYEIIRKGRWDP